jgi:tetratricopeptide (TPR) repeat protein
MKICPFISHMIGDDRADILQIDGSDAAPKTAKSTNKKKSGAGKDVVILGYDGESAVGVATQSAKSKKADAVSVTHLFCLKDTCRFFQKKTGECKFDSVFDMSTDHKTKIEEVEKQLKKIDAVQKHVEKIDAVDKLIDKIGAVEQQIKKLQSEGGDKESEKTAARVTKELDKFWKFQTKSVSELIASIGETEKKQGKSFADFRKDLDKTIGSWKPELDLKAIEDVKGEVTALQSAVEAREDGIESFSTTISELIMNLDDTMRQLQNKNETLAERIVGLESSFSDTEKAREKLEKTLDEKLKTMKAPDLSNKVESLGTRYDARFEELLEAHRRIEDSFKDWKKAIETRVNEIREDQTSWKSHLERIEKAQSKMIAMVREDKQRLEDESSVFKRKEAKKLNNLGVTSFHNGEFELARDQFLEAVALDPHFAESWNNLGLVYTELQEEEKATQAFTKAIDNDPDLPAAYNNLGYIFYKQGSYDHAIEMYNEALGRSSDNSSAYTNLGNAYFKQGDHQKARQAWEKALEIDPDNEKASRNLKRLESE